ncbi:ParB/RepB/Spo0J family partition protein [Aestuariibius sp. 2305UL40-4]|uniref:ParB/RepB/Spo0J family partition protein n=1 Tax=Aestuariibius violaceus TaxID=3234132 RepID=UPI00398F36BA
MTKQEKIKTNEATKATEAGVLPTMPTRAIHEIPLARLDLSVMNPRQNVEDAEIAALADSIRTVGLMQNLMGVLMEDSRVAIVAGGRRLRALKAIAAEDGQDEAEVLVPVLVTDDEAEAQVWASTENTARLALNPADEIRAYGRMVETGASVETIAKAFAVSVRHVTGRLRLAGLAPVILEALRAGEITLDVAAAYTVTGDVAAQEATFTRLQEGYGGDNPAQIKRMLMQEAVSAESSLARFVGRAAFEDAGGAIREDLFGADIWFCDLELVRGLAEAKLSKAKAALEAEGWAWVSAQIEPIPYEVLAEYRRTYPEQRDISEDEHLRYEELGELIEAEVCNEDGQAEFVALEAKLNEEHFTATQKAHAGVMVAIAWDGTLDLRQGLVRPEDQAAAAEAGVIEESRHAKAAKPATPYPTSVMDDLAAIRTGCIQAALIRKPELALDLLTFALSTPCYADAMPLQIGGKAARNTPEKADEGMALPDRLAPKEYRMPLNGSEASDAFTAFRAQSKKARNAMLTEQITRLFAADLALDRPTPLVEQIANLAEADIRSIWTPTKDFLARLKSDQLDGIMAEIIGTEIAPAFAKSPKKDKVEKLHKMFTEETARAGLSKEAKARLDAWLPDGMTVRGD